MGVLITLSRPDNVSRPFDYDDAQRLLNMPNNGGWFLPDDATHYMDGKQLKVKESTKAARKAKKEDTE